MEVGSFPLTEEVKRFRSLYAADEGSKMQGSQKGLSALRAVVALAGQYGAGPAKMASIARPRAIPQRLLQVIFGEFKRTGLVRSRRGGEGGDFSRG